jgi:multicomponent Na+:H+ antiporter subunit C
MTQPVFWALVGMALVTLGLYALVVHAHLLRKLLALNIISSGVFLVFIGLAQRAPQTDTGLAAAPDPVPQAMVLTGIVVAVAATALALALIVRLRALTGCTSLEEDTDG